MKKNFSVLIFMSFWISAAIAQEPDDAISPFFANEGLTLKITARCDAKEFLCPFQAEIMAPESIMKLIEGVDYTYAPDRRKSPGPVTDASTHFRFEGKQQSGEIVNATVTYRPEGSSVSKKMLVKGRIPFATEVAPELPSGLRFEVKYEQEYSEEAPADYYCFKIWLRGSPNVLEQIKGVEYQLPAAYFLRERIQARKETGYFLDGTALADSDWQIVVVIRWVEGRSSAYVIPFHPRK